MMVTIHHLPPEIVRKIAIRMSPHDLLAAREALGSESWTPHDFSFAIAALTTFFKLGDNRRIPKYNGARDDAKHHPSSFSAKDWNHLGPGFMAAFMLTCTNFEILNVISYEYIEQPRRYVIMKITGLDRNLITEAVKIALATPERRSKLSLTKFFVSKSNTKNTYFRLLCTLGMTEYVKETLEEKSGQLDKLLMDGYLAALLAGNIDTKNLICPYVIQEAEAMSEKNQQDLFAACMDESCTRSTLDSLSNVLLRVTLHDYLARCVINGYTDDHLEMILKLTEETGEFDASSDASKWFTINEAMLLFLRRKRSGEIQESLKKLLRNACDNVDVDSILIHRFLGLYFWDLFGKLFAKEGHLEDFVELYHCFQDVCETLTRHRNGKLLQRPAEIEALAHRLHPLAAFAFSRVLVDKIGPNEIDTEKTDLVKLLLPANLNEEATVKAAEEFICAIELGKSHDLIASIVEEHNGMTPWLKFLARFVSSCGNMNMHEAIHAFSKLPKHQGAKTEVQLDDFSRIILYKNIIHIVRLLTSNVDHAQLVKWIIDKDSVNVPLFRAHITHAVLSSFLATRDDGDQRHIQQLLEGSPFRYAGKMIIPLADRIPLTHINQVTASLMWKVYVGDGEAVRSLLYDPYVPTAFLESHALRAVLQASKHEYPLAPWLGLLRTVLSDPRVNAKMILEDRSAEDLLHYEGESIVRECLVHECGSLNQNSFWLLKFASMENDTLRVMERLFPRRVSLHDIYTVKSRQITQLKSDDSFLDTFLGDIFRKAIRSGESEVVPVRLAEFSKVMALELEILAMNPSTKLLEEESAGASYRRAEFQYALDGWKEAQKFLADLETAAEISKAESVDPKGDDKGLPCAPFFDFGIMAPPAVVKFNSQVTGGFLLKGDSSKPPSFDFGEGKSSPDFNFGSTATSPSESLPAVSSSLSRGPETGFTTLNTSTPETQVPVSSCEPTPFMFGPSQNTSTSQRDLNNLSPQPRKSPFSPKLRSPSSFNKHRIFTNQSKSAESKAGSSSLLLNALKAEDLPMVRLQTALCTFSSQGSRSQFLHTAIRIGTASSLAAFLANFPCPNDTCGAALAIACRSFPVPIVKVLLDSPNFDPSYYYSLPLRFACSRENHTEAVEIVQLLLKDRRVRPASAGCDALRRACMERNVPLVKVLIEDTRLKRATLRGSFLTWLENDMEMMEFLLDTLSFDLLDSISTIRFLIQGHHYKILERALSVPRSNEILEDMKERHCIPSLFIALLQRPSSEASRKTLTVMLGHEFFDPTAEESTILHFCVWHRRVEELKILLEDGRVDVNSRNGLAMRMALERGYDEVVEMLSAYLEKTEAMEASTMNNNERTQTASKK
ncbi:hypothetical protein HDU97_008953 [Phlyctochytrium planicorne]|nr:hypothetical protein HDU97_008953 [Phlyctochytrium planicorne]